MKGKKDETAYQIKLASNQAEIDHFKESVFQKYCLDMQWIDSSLFPDKMLSDRHDECSVYILVCEAEKLCGGTRLVKDSVHGFPHERQIGLTLPFTSLETPKKVKNKLKAIDRSRIMEITRTFNAAARKTITKDFVKAYYWYGTGYGIDAYFMVIDMAFFGLCHKISVPIHPISTPGFIEGSWTIPCILFTDEIKENLKEKNPDFWDYVKDRSNLDQSLIKNRAKK